MSLKENLDLVDGVVLPADLAVATAGMDITPDLVSRYCNGPRVERGVGRSAMYTSLAPIVREKSQTAVAVLDLLDVMLG